MRKKLLVILSVILVLAFACTSTEQVVKQDTSQVQEEQPDVFKVEAKGKDFNIALNSALELACRKYVQKYYGTGREEAKYDDLYAAIYQKTRVRKYVDYEINDKYSANDLVHVIATVEILKEKINPVIESILGESSSNSSTNSSNNGNTSDDSNAGIMDGNSAEDVKVDEILNSMNQEDKKAILSYVNKLMFMAYFEKDNVKVDNEYIRYAVSRINTFLSRKNYEYVDMGQVQKLAESDEIIRMVESSGDSELQVIADKFSTDIYIVVDPIITKGEKDGIPYAQVNLTLKIFETATGRGLGEEQGVSQPYGSNISFDAAVRKAIDEAINQAMTKAIKSARNKMILAFKDGIRYKLKLLNFDSTMNRLKFEKLIKQTSKYKSYKRLNSTKEEANYFVYYMGTLEQFEMELFELAMETPGFENFDEVMANKNSIVLTLGY